jgi:hypothetical protein
LTQTDTNMLTRAVRSAREMYPDAEIKVRRGRPVVYQGDLIRLITFDSDKAPANREKASQEA